jgi:putative phage-type endonuclease
MNVLVRTEEMPREEWLAWRNKGIGGSDAAAVCSMSRWKSPMDVWLEKTGQAEPREAGEAAHWGTLLEPIIRKEFINRTGLDVREEKSIIQHEKYPFMLANIDGIVEHPVRGEGILEIKTAGAYFAKDWENGLSDEYLLQVNHYMAVTGYPYAYVAVLIGGNQFKWLLVERDDELIRMMLKMESAFWHMVMTKTPPPIDGSNASCELLKRLYPESRAKSKITLPDDALQLIKVFEAAQAAEAEATLRKDTAGNKLKEMLGEHETGTVGNRTVSWKSINSEKLNTKLLKSHYPSLYEEHTYFTSYRRFTIK